MASFIQPMTLESASRTGYFRHHSSAQMKFGQRLHLHHLTEVHVLRWHRKLLAVSNLMIQAVVARLCSLLWIKVKTDKCKECNENLRKLQLSENNSCSFCKDTQTLAHLLYECPYAKMVWQYVSVEYNKNITLYDVICGTDNVVYDTLIGYLCNYRVNLLNKTKLNV